MAKNNIDFPYISYVYDSECVIEYPDLKVVGTGETFEEAFKEAQKNKKNFLKYLKEHNLPLPKKDRQQKNYFEL